jgi:superfamily II RNA helicase
MEQILDRPMVLVEETKRPVPLTFAFQAQNRFYTDFKDFKEDAYKDLKKPRRYFRGRRPKDPITPNSLPRLIERIKGEDGFPCLYFAFGRKLTEELAYNSLPNMQLSKMEKEEIEKRFSELCEKYAVQNEPTIKKLTPLVRNGLAYHHAGMLPTTKEIIEQLFNEKRLKMIFATETFALGLNMPVRTVIFDSIRKYYPGGFDVLKTRDFFQMAGRAGRRGMDDFGRVYLRINPRQVRADQVKNCVYGEAQPVLSQFNASYATLLNLYDKHGEDVISIYPSTLNYFQASKRQRRIERQKFLDRLQVLKKTGCIRNDALTNKGRFACWFFGYELIMSELFMAGLLDRWDPVELGLALATLVYEAKPGTPPIRHLPNRLSRVLREVTKAYYQIEIVEGSYRIENPVRAPEPSLMKATELWLKNANFQDTVQASKIDEGELIRYFRMIIQLARQLTQAPNVSEKIVKTAEDLRRLMDRGVVDAERQLRS